MGKRNPEEENKAEEKVETRANLENKIETHLIGLGEDNYKGRGNKKGKDRKAADQQNKARNSKKRHETES